MKDKTLFSVLSFITHPLTGLAVVSAWILILFPPVCAVVLRLSLWSAKSVGYDFPSAINLVFGCGAVSIIIIISLIGCMGRWVDRVVIRIAEVSTHRRIIDRE